MKAYRDIRPPIDLPAAELTGFPAEICASRDQIVSDATMHSDISHSLLHLAIGSGDPKAVIIKLVFSDSHPAACQIAIIQIQRLPESGGQEALKLGLPCQN
jgi:hypothetical protein